MRRDEVIRRLQALRDELADRYGVKTLSLFGSVARDEATEQSDVDLLVELATVTEQGRAFGDDLVGIGALNGDVGQLRLDALHDLGHVGGTTHQQQRVDLVVALVLGARENLMHLAQGLLQAGGSELLELFPGDLDHLPVALELDALGMRRTRG